MLLTSVMLYCIICRRRAASSGDSFGGMTGCCRGASSAGAPSTGMIGSTCFTVGILVLLLCSSKLSFLVSAVKVTLFPVLRGLLPSLALAPMELDPSLFMILGPGSVDSALVLLSKEACSVSSWFGVGGPPSSAFDGISFTPALRRLSSS